MNGITILAVLQWYWHWKYNQNIIILNIKLMLITVLECLPLHCHQQRASLSSKSDGVCEGVEFLKINFLKWYVFISYVFISPKICFLFFFFFIFFFKYWNRLMLSIKQNSVVASITQLHFRLHFIWNKWNVNCIHN